MATANGSVTAEPAPAGKEIQPGIEAVTTNERVPGHPGYYEKGGLRTYGDGEDHDVEPPMTFRRIMSLVAMAFLWTGSQIPVYIFGSIPPYIYRDIGGTDRWIWFILAYLLSLAAICPFVGNLSDLIGRRWVAIIGAGLLILGTIICSTANEMNIFIGGMVFAGIGAGIGELTALAVTSELAPTRKRGTYVAILVFTILPFCPSVLWAQLIASHTTWRHCGTFVGVWNLVALLATLFFYFPPPRVNSRGLNRKQILSEIDWIGGFLSISGMILFMAGMQWGGYQYSWKTAHVLVPLILGFFLLVAFVLYEAYAAPHPMFPHRLLQEPRILAMTLVITFISGAQFFSVIMFFPTEAYNVWGHDPIGVGIRGLPIGFAILGGACIVLALLSILRGHNKELLIFSSILMTAGTGALAVARRDNLNTLWGLLVLAGIGIGGIVVPASIMSTIICPDDLIATVAALTLSIRVIGGSIGYCIYYNVFINKFVPNAIKYIGGTMVFNLTIYDQNLIREAIELTGASLIEELHHIPGIGDNQTAWNMVVVAGQTAYAESYKYVYLASIAFGAVAILASFALGNIDKYMDDHVAVVMH